MQDSQSQPVSLPLTWSARVLLLTMAPLIFIGGGVTSQDAGMAYPTAPLSDGALINPAGWMDQAATFWEHGHRLVGWIVGILCIVCVAASWMWEKNKGVRYLAIFILFAVVIQGIMGITRVERISTGWAMIHGIWAQCCFLMGAILVLVTTPGWRRKLPSTNVVNPKYLQALRISVLCLVPGLLFQVSLGSATRHLGSNVAVLLHGSWGVMMAVLAAWAASWTFKIVRESGWMQKLAVLQVTAMITQVLLGFITFFVTEGSSARITHPTLAEWIIPTLHVVLGAISLALAGCWTLTLLRLVSMPRGQAVVDAPSTSGLVVHP